MYCDRPLKWRDLWRLFLPAVAAVLTPWAYGVYRMYYAYARYGPVAALAWGPPWFRLAAIALVPFLILAIWRILRSRWEISVCQQGLRIQRPFQGILRLRWQQIEAVACKSTQETFMGRQLTARYRLVIFPSQGKPIRIHPKIKKLDELIARIKAKVYPHLLPTLRADLRSGKNLYFGSIEIDRKRLKLRGKAIPWEEVTLINLHKGHLVIKFQGRRDQKIPVQQIPNLELLIQLIQEGVEV